MCMEYEVRKNLSLAEKNRSSVNVSRRISTLGTGFMTIFIPSDTLTKYVIYSYRLFFSRKAESR
jgi:hypothetical protein